MLDIQLFRDNPNLIREGLSKRHQETEPVDQVISLDEKRRDLIQEVERLRAERNQESKAISKLEDPDERQEKIAAMRAVGDQLDGLVVELNETEAALDELLATFPNLPDKRVPVGQDESNNELVKEPGDLPKLDFIPQPHWDLGPKLGILDFERGVKSRDKVLCPQ